MGCKLGSVAEVLTAVTLPVAARPGEPQAEATQAGNLGPGPGLQLEVQTCLSILLLPWHRFGQVGLSTACHSLFLSTPTLSRSLIRTRTVTPPSPSRTGSLSRLLLPVVADMTSS